MNATTQTSLLALLALGLGATSAAQNRPIAFPQGAKNGNWGYWGPLGEGCSPNSIESRTQILFPAEYLPTRTGTVWSLDHIPVSITNATYPCASVNSSTVQYALLEITLAHRARSNGPNGIGPLSTTFANNLPSPPPTPVFSGSWTGTWTHWTWNSIQFAQGFAYDGVSDIVVEIKKIVTPTGQNMATLRNLNSTRTDLPRQVIRTGPGMSNAVTGNYVDLMAWRLHFDNVSDPTLEVRAGRGPMNFHFERGVLAHYRVFDSTGDVFAIAANFNFLPSPIPLPPAAGMLWLPPPVTVMFSGVVPPSPGTVYHRCDLQLPVDPALVNLRVCAQAATLDAGTGAIDLTNAVDFVIM